MRALAHLELESIFSERYEENLRIDKSAVVLGTSFHLFIKYKLQIHYSNNEIYFFYCLNHINICICINIDDMALYIYFKRILTHTFNFLTFLI